MKCEKSGALDASIPLPEGASTGPSLAAIRNGAVPMAQRRCPRCRGDIDRAGSGYRCAACAREFPVNAAGQRDFRLLADDSIHWDLTYQPARYDRAIAVRARREAPCLEKRNRFVGSVPWHLTAAQISYIPEAKPGEIALDLGCGAGIHREVLEALGYAYHGVDYQGEGAHDLVDAHALPFEDRVFDLVLAIALLEHIAQPPLALREAERVLKPGKRIVGTVAFLEPFHDNSFFHFSPVGVASALEASGLVLEDLFAIRGWDSVRAQLEMGFERARLPRFVAYLLSRPFVAAVESYALLGRLAARDKQRHSRDLAHARHAGAFFYVARRPG